MAEFESCDKCKYTALGETQYPCSKCIHSAKEHYTPKTNADRIREMTDEELAEFLLKHETSKIESDFCENVCELRNDNCPVAEEDGECLYSDSGSCVLKWLQAERQERNTTNKDSKKSLYIFCRYG